jgi:hypothetical protein
MAAWRELCRMARDDADLRRRIARLVRPGYGEDGVQDLPTARRRIASRRFASDSSPPDSISTKSIGVGHP